MTFSQFIKNKLISLEYCDNNAVLILQSYFDALKNSNSIKYKKNQIIVSFKNNNIFLFLCKMLKKNIFAKINYVIVQNNIIFNGNSFLISKLNKKNNFNLFFNNFTYASNFLIGAFLATGSISLAKSNYYFEIYSYNKNYINLINKIFKKYEIISKILLRKNKYICYCKQFDNISDILKFFNNSEIVLTFENNKLKRNFDNKLKRLNNIDIVNQQKILKTSKNQIAKIKEYMKTEKYNKQNERFKLFCDLRIKNPEKSIKEIVNIMGQKNQIISKSGLNYYLSIIMKK